MHCRLLQEKPELHSVIQGIGMTSGLACMVSGCEKTRTKNSDSHGRRGTLCPNHQKMLYGRTNNVDSVRVEEWKKKLAKNLDSTKKYQLEIQFEPERRYHICGQIKCMVMDCPNLSVISSVELCFRHNTILSGKMPRFGGVKGLPTRS